MRGVRRGAARVGRHRPTLPWRSQTPPAARRATSPPPTTPRRAGYPPSAVPRRISIPCVRAAGRSEDVSEANVAVELRLVRRRNDVPVSASPVLRLRERVEVGAYEEEAIVGASGQVVTTRGKVEQPDPGHVFLVAHLETEQVIRADPRRIIERDRNLRYVLVRAVEIDARVGREVDAGVHHVTRHTWHAVPGKVDRLRVVVVVALEVGELGVGERI